ncbi:MAG: FtsX-like permease family protein [Gemmatimonadota bacterium]
MLSPRWRKVLRDSWLHRGRTVLVILAMAVGLAGAGVILNAWALVRVATREGFGASNPASATLRVDSVDDALVARVISLPGVRLAQARRSTVARVQVNGATFPALLFTVQDFQDIRIGKVKLESGAWPPEDGGLVIERSSLDMSGASIGDEVRLSFGDGAPINVTVRGIARDVGLAPGWMEHVIYGFVTAETLSRLHAPSTLNELQLVIGDGSLNQEDVRTMAFAVRRNLEAAGVPVRDVNVPVPGEHPHAAQMDSLLYTQGAFAVMALVLSTFLVVNLISALLVGQTREIGVMKAIGARWPQIAAMYLSVAVLLGAVAVALALPVALIGGRAYAILKGDLLNFEVQRFHVPAWVIVAQLLVGLLLPLVAAAAPVWQGCRVAVNDALRDVGLSSAADPGSLPQRITGLSRPILLSLRNAFRRRQRLALTLLALSMGGAVFLGASNLRASVRGATDVMFAGQRFDIALRLADPQDPDVLERIARAVPGVLAAESWTGTRGTVDHGDGVFGNPFPISAPPAATTLLSPVADPGRWLAPGDGRVLVVNRALLRAEPSLQVGRRATVIIQGQPSEWTVIGITESGPSATAFAPREVVAPLATDGRATSLVVSTAADGDGPTLDVILRLRAALGDAGMPVASSQMMAESRRVIEDHLLLVVDFLGSVGWLMLLIGGMGLASTMSLAVLERRREIGVLRAIGARHESIFALVQVEGLTIAVLSWALAIPISVPISAALAVAFGRIMLRVPVTFVPEPNGILAWLGLVVGASVVGCAWPAVRAMRMPVAGALGWE